MNNNFTYGLTKKDYQILVDLVNAYSELSFSQLVNKMRSLFMHEITFNHFIALGAIINKTKQNEKIKINLSWQRQN